MKSSLPYQLLLYLGSYYFACFLGIELLLLIYKSIILPYKSFTLFSEVKTFVEINQIQPLDYDFGLELGNILITQVTSMKMISRAIESR